MNDYNNARFNGRHGSVLAVLVAIGLAVFNQYQHQHRSYTPPASQSEPGSAAGQRDGGQSDQSNGVAGQFDYYVMSLSWSPTYCLTHTEDTVQCGHRGFGFVLHGLWPQYDSGGYPEECATNQSVGEDAFAFGRTVYPSPKLVNHEWQEHGTCSGMDAMTYFKLASRAQAGISVPPVLEAPAGNQDMSVQQLLDAFHASNPALPENALVVECSRQQLSEVRVCLTRDLQPRACGRGVRTHCGQEQTFTVRAAR